MRHPEFFDKLRTGFVEGFGMTSDVGWWWAIKKWQGTPKERNWVLAFTWGK